jgi:ABC transporter substrate binding protein
LAADLIRRQPAVIIGNILATRAVMAATTTIPVVFIGSADPVRTGLVASLNHPGGNVTGAVFTSSDLAAKRLGLLHDLVPKSVAIAALFHPDAPGADLYMEEVGKAGQTIGRQVLIVKVTDESEFHAAFATMAQQSAGGLLIGSSPYFLSRRRQLAALAAFISEKASGLTEKDHLSSIKDRLKNIMDLYKVSRYRPAPDGVYLSDEASAVRVGPSPFSGQKSDGGGGVGREVGSTSAGQRDGEAGNIYHLFEKKGGLPSDKTSADPFPRVDWVSIENGGREAGDALEDKAATYIPNQNRLHVNADFRVFKDMISRLCKEKEGPGVGMQKAVEEIVHQWFEQALIETVIGIQQLRGSKEWTPSHVEKALSPEALTSTVMQRYHVYIACRRELGAKFGKFAASG